MADLTALLDLVKRNAVIETDADDELLMQYIRSAIGYAEYFQTKDYTTENAVEMPPATVQAIVILATGSYESRDGATAGFFADSTAAAQQTKRAADTLLATNRGWNV